MTNRDNDPWICWYDDYLAHRAAMKAAMRLARERRRVATLLAGLLMAYMLLGGLVASVAVGLVMAN